MPKNIVICCDGTGNEFGDRNSNVIKLYSALVRDPKSQVVYYHPGLGTAGVLEKPTPIGRLKKFLRKVFGLAFGRGLFANIARAYSFLMEQYEPGDHVFLFGFSRGAYTVKALCSLIYMFGVIERGNGILVEYAVALFTNRSQRNKEVSKGFQETFGRDIDLHFVGLFDTVSSVGWAYDPLSLPYTWENPDIKTGRHAISIDERRCFFRQNHWGSGEEHQDIKEVWFPGVHSDIGGGYPEEESHLSKIALQWMMNEAESAGLLVDQEEKKKILGGTAEYVGPDAKGPIHESLNGVWWIPEWLPKPYWDFSKKPRVKRFMWPRGRSRSLPDGALVHESAINRMDDSSLRYKPSNLPSKYTVVRG